MNLGQGELNENCLELLWDLPNLKRLNISGNDTLSEAQLRPLMHLQGLTNLNMSHMGIEEKSVQFLIPIVKSLKKLTSLNLASNHLSDDTDLTNAFLQELAKHKKLEKIDLSDNSLTYKNMPFLKELQKTTTVNIKRNFLNLDAE